MYSPYVTYKQHCIGEKMDMLLDNTEHRAVLTMKLDGATITVTRLMTCPNRYEDRYTLASLSRFSMGASNRYGVWTMTSITWKRAVTVLERYQGDLSQWN